MMRRRCHVATVALAGVLASACSATPSGTDGDCSARIGWADGVYRSHNELDPEAPRGERLGVGDVLDCDGTRVATVPVFAVEGVEPSLAIITTGDWPGIYVVEGAPSSSWPSGLR